MRPSHEPATDVTHNITPKQAKMASFRERDKCYFPLKSIDDVVDLFKGQLENGDEPDLTLLSIVIGAVECCLTVNRTVNNKSGNNQATSYCAASFPGIHLATVEALYQRFAVHVKGSVDLTRYSGKYATRELVKKVSDVIWNSLARSYHKDKAHLQSVYSFLTGSKLDCFGVALATVAACQQLSYHDVHLALSEDHAWVVFGETGTDTIEVTWHGKGLEDKRGLPISPGLEEKSWLYLNGHAMRCNRYTEVAAIVAAINPAINSTMDSVEMTSLQQKLLWYLYEKGHLDKYPQALSNLGELEDASPTRPATSSARDLMVQATTAAQDHYSNMHVYPYTSLGSYHYRKGEYRAAIENWAKAASVIKQYNHNREDEEIYKEFLEIANDHLPNITKACGDELHRAYLIPPDHTPLLQDPVVYSRLLQFYDGICEWEEGSSTPVLHTVWAQHLVHTLSKFDQFARSGVDVGKPEKEDEEAEVDDETSAEPKWKLRRESLTQPERQRKNSCEVKKRGRGRPPKKPATTTVTTDEKENNNDVKPNGILEFSSYSDGVPAVTVEKPDVAETESHEMQIKSAIEELVSRVGNEVPNAVPNPKLAALAQACGESILNPEYLIAGGEPFAMSAECLFKESDADGNACPTKGTDESFDVAKVRSSSTEGFMDSDASAKDPDTDTEAQIVPEHKSSMSPPSVKSVTSQDELPTPDPPNQIQLNLSSAKMKALKEILVAKKLNANAIKLQLTAQSQVYLKNSGTAGNVALGNTRKRLRRE